MADPKFQYDPVDGHNNVEIFPPNPAKETVRGLIQKLFDQVRDFINATLIPWVKAYADAVIPGNIPVGTITDDKLSDADGQLKDRFTTQLSDIAKYIVNVKHPPSGISAIGDGLTDDTDAINAIIALVKTNKYGGIYFPDGTYMIRATSSDSSNYYGEYGGIIIDAPMSVILHPNAELKAITGNQDGYTILNIKNTHHVNVVGGIITGERTTHIGATGQWGHGIRVISSQYIHISDIICSNCWGDGIYIGLDNTGDTDNQYIYLNNVICDNNRRNGLSITNGFKIFVKNCSLTNTNGQAPQAGIDIERNAGWTIPNNIFIDGCYFYNNTINDIVFGDNCTNVSITNCQMIGCPNISISFLTDPMNDILIENNIISLAAGALSGIRVRESVDKCYIRNNTIYNATYASSGSGISVYDNEGMDIIGNIIYNCTNGIYLTGTNGSKNLKILGNTISAITQYGIYINKALSDSIINDNLLVDFIVGCGHMIFGVQALTNVMICNNSFKNNQKSGIYAPAVGCLVSNNNFNAMGQLTPASYPSVRIDGAIITCSDNFINANYFRNSDTNHPSVTSPQASTLPNVVKNNNCMYTTLSKAFVLQASDKVLGNLCSDVQA